MCKTPLNSAGSLMIAARRLQTLKDRTFEFYGIGRSQRQVLLLVVANPGITQARLARLLKLDRSTVNLLVRKLKRARMVTIEPSDLDRRCRAIIPTNLARTCCTAFDEEQPYLEAIVTHDFSSAEREQFHNLLRRASAVIQHVLDLPPGEEFPPLFAPHIPQRRAQ